MDRKAEILTMLKIPDIDFFIPAAPLSFDPMKDEMVNGRHWVIQGETLQFFMVIRLSRLLSGKQIPKLEDDLTPRIIPAQPHSPEEAFVPREWEGSSSDSGDSSNAADIMETSKGRTSVNLEILQSPTFRMRLKELLSKLEIIIEFMKGRSKIRSSKKTQASSESSPVSVDIHHVFQKCFSLPNGDIVYPLTTDVSIKSRYVGHHISLAVAIYPPEPEMSINQLISPIYVERSAIRMVAVPVLVIEPVAPVITTKQVGSVMYASVSITNNHTQPIVLEDAHLNLYDVRKPDSPLSTFEYHSNYEIELYKDSFPFELEPTEQYNFVTSIAAVASNLTDEDCSISNTVPELHLKWHTQDLCGSMLTPMKIPFPKSEGKLLITFDTGEQPIQLHTIFPISLTIYNLSKQARDIILEIPLIKFEGQSERFFADATIVNSVVQIPPTPRYDTRVNTQLSNAGSPNNETNDNALGVNDTLQDTNSNNNNNNNNNDNNNNRNGNDKNNNNHNNINDNDNIINDNNMPDNGNHKSGDNNQQHGEDGINDTVEISVTSDNEAEIDLASDDVIIDTKSELNTPEGSKTPEFTNGRKRRRSSFAYPITNQRLESWDKKVDIFDPPASTFREYEDSRQSVASVMCLEKVIYIGNIAANSQATTRIECVAMSQGLFTLKEVKAIDTISQKEFLVKEGCQIYIA